MIYAISKLQYDKILERRTLKEKLLNPKTFVIDYLNRTRKAGAVGVTRLNARFWLERGRVKVGQKPYQDKFVSKTEGLITDIRIV